MRRAVPLLALLLIPAALAQVPEGRPPIPVVHQPRWSVGDYWEYEGQVLGSNGTLPQRIRVEVLDETTHNGTAVFRLQSRAESQGPPDEYGTQTFTFTNRTMWVAKQGLQVLRIEEVSDRVDQLWGGYKVMRRTSAALDFRFPLDAYAYPIYNHAWVVVSDLSISSNLTVVTQTWSDNKTTYTNRTYNTSAVRQTATTQWLRQDVLQVPVGTFDVVVLQTVEGNGTVFEYVAPAAGNVVRREVIAGNLIVENSALVGYRIRHPWTPPAPPTQAAGFGVDLLPVAGAAGIGVLAAGAGLAWRERRRKAAGGPRYGAGPDRGPDPPGPGS